jgi:hypothetical protein
MKGAIQTGLFSANETVLDISPICPTGNCTFPPYLSLAVCTSFANITPSLYSMNTSSSVQHYISNTSYLTPNGLFNISSAALLDSSPTGLNFSTSIAFQNVSLPLADIAVLYLSNYDTKGGKMYAAAEFVLEWCVQNFTTTVVDGKATTQRLNSFRNFTNPTNPNLVLFGSKGEEFSVFLPTHHATSRYLSQNFNGWMAKGTFQYMNDFLFARHTLTLLRVS